MMPWINPLHYATTKTDQQIGLENNLDDEQLPRSRNHHFVVGSGRIALLISKHQVER